MSEGVVGLVCRLLLSLRAAADGWAAACALRGIGHARLLVQEIPEIGQHLIKSGLHFQVVIDRGCDSLNAAAAQAVARISSHERALYEYGLPESLA